MWNLIIYVAISLTFTVGVSVGTAIMADDMNRRIPISEAAKYLSTQFTRLTLLLLAVTFLLIFLILRNGEVLQLLNEWIR